MSNERNGWGLVLAGLALLTFTGCPNPAGQGGKTGKGGDAHGHDHDHAHDHVHSGPHKGHLMEIGGEEYHAEWTHDESGKVTFYILDSEAKKEVPIAAEEITINVKVGENPTQDYKLAAVTPQDGKAAAFEIVDKQFEGLFGMLKSDAVVLNLHVNINGKQFDERIQEHEH